MLKLYAIATFIDQLIFGIEVLVLEKVKFLILPFVKVPEPETVCTLLPFKVRFPALVAPTEISIAPSFTMFPFTVNVFPVVPLKTLTKPPEFTLRSLFTANEAGVVP